MIHCAMEHASHQTTGKRTIPNGCLLSFRGCFDGIIHGQISSHDDGGTQSVGKRESYRISLSFNQILEKRPKAPP